MFSSRISHCFTIYFNFVFSLCLCGCCCCYFFLLLFFYYYFKIVFHLYFFTSFHTQCLFSIYFLLFRRAVWLVLLLLLCGCLHRRRRRRCCLFLILSIPAQRKRTSFIIRRNNELKKKCKANVYHNSQLIFDSILYFALSILSYLIFFSSSKKETHTQINETDHITLNKLQRIAFFSHSLLCSSSLFRFGVYVCLFCFKRNT